MDKEKPQTFENHVRWVPAYHFVALPIFAINVFWSLVSHLCILTLSSQS